MQIKTTTNRPSMLECRRHLGQRAWTLNYDIEELRPEAIDGAEGSNLPQGSDPATSTGYEAPAEYRYKSIEFYPWNWDYDSIVSAIINADCPPDRMAAIQNNYLLDPTDPAALADFNAMQSLRARAKTLARQALEQSGQALT